MVPPIKGRIFYISRSELQFLLLYFSFVTAGAAAAAAATAAMAAVAQHNRGAAAHPLQNWHRVSLT